MKDFSRYLDISLSRIPVVLMNDETRQKFLKLSQHLPEIFSHSLFGYEKHLSAENDEMDMSVSAGHKGEYSFHSIFDYSVIADYLSGSIQWQGLKNFSRLWKDPANNIHNLLELVVLEFDASSLTENIPVPSVFFGIEKELYNKNPDYEELMARRLNVLIKSIETAAGNSVEPDVKKVLKEISDKTLNKCQIFQAGLMLSRINSPLKICIKRFHSQELKDFIPCVIPEGAVRDAILNIHLKYADHFDELILVLDLFGNEIRKAGIECYFRNKKQPPEEARWRIVLDRLANDGLCRKELKQAVISFPKKFMLYGFSKNAPNYYAQGLHHFKFVTDGHITSAKIYFWSGFHWK